MGKVHKEGQRVCSGGCWRREAHGPRTAVKAGSTNARVSSTQENLLHFATEISPISRARQFAGSVAPGSLASLTVLSVPLQGVTAGTISAHTALPQLSIHSQSFPSTGL